jgi:hypothetical protein
LLFAEREDASAFEADVASHGLDQPQDQPADR